MDQNIEYYYSLLQKNILVVEADEENKTALDAVTVNFMAVYEYIKMFLIAKKERYYGYFLMDMELKIDYFFDGEAGVNMDTMPFTIRVNPLLLGKCSIKEMVFIICHEIEHIVLEHPVEAKKINHNSDPWEHVALNYAMDASVNDRLLMEIDRYKLSLMTCSDDMVTSQYLSDEYGVELNKLMDFLYYYDKIVTFEMQVIEEKEYEENEYACEQDELCENEENFQQEDVHEVEDREREIEMPDLLDNETEGFWDEADELIKQDQTKTKGGKRRDKSKSEDDKIVFIVDIPNSSRIITAKNRPMGVSLHKWTEMDLPDEIREQLRQFVQQVVDGIPDEVRGLFPSYQQEALKKVLEKTHIKWEQMLKKYVGTIPNGYRRTRTRLDRRQPERYDISGKVSRHTIDIVVAIDTSGSMSARLLERIFAEIFSIVKAKVFHLTIIECDADIQNIYEARSMSDVQLEVHGRGGTSFIPVIKYVNENKKYRKSLLIYFTDGMGDFTIPRPMVYRMLWVLPNEDNCKRLSVEEPYGEVISMNVDLKELYN